MLPDSIKQLVLEEQERQANRFIEDVAIEDYLAKVSANAEFVFDSADGRCRGAVAFYCNDHSTKLAFITFLVVDPRDRGSGVASSLVHRVLELARQRGFRSCRLEVAKANDPARSMYRSLGFRLVETRSERELLEIAL